jgi:hypothetical protein
MAKIERVVGDIVDFKMVQIPASKVKYALFTFGL